VQKSRRDGRQPRDNEVGRLSIEHRAQFADLRALADAEAEFFQSLFEELSKLPFLSTAKMSMNRPPTGNSTPVNLARFAIARWTSCER